MANLFSRKFLAAIFALIANILLVEQVLAYDLGAIIDPVRNQYRSYYETKRALIKKLDKQGGLTGQEYYVLAFTCQVDDTPDSILLRMTKAAKCGKDVVKYFSLAGVNGVPEGFYEASKKMDNAGQALGFALLAYALAPANSVFGKEVEDELPALKGRFLANGGNEAGLHQALDITKKQLAEMQQQGPYAGKSVRDALLDKVRFDKLPVGAAFSSSNEGPFGLRFGMSPAEVKLKAVPSDSYGKDAYNAYSKYYSCNKEMTYLLGGDYEFSSRNVTLQDPNLLIRAAWINAMGSGNANARAMAQDLFDWHRSKLAENEFRAKYRITRSFQLSNQFPGIAVRNYASGSGTTLCLMFYKDRLVRVKANLSAKRNLISGIVDKLKTEYAGGMYAHNKHNSPESEVTTYRWSASEKGVWVTVQHRDYKPAKNADYSRAYAYGATYVPPKPAQLQAYVDYTYMPLYSAMIGDYAGWAVNTLERQAEQKREATEEAIDEF